MAKVTCDADGETARVRRGGTGGEAKAAQLSLPHTVSIGSIHVPSFRHCFLGTELMRREKPGGHLQALGRGGHHFCREEFLKPRVTAHRILEGP